jgi:dTDP-4-dehydrorhamnose reductase
VEGIPTSEYPTPATRPAYSVLDCSRIRERFGIWMPSWTDALDRAMEDQAPES